MITATDVQIVTRGDIGARHQQLAREQIAKVGRYVGDPILFARVKLTLTNDPANARHAVARAMLDVNGQPVRAVASAGTVPEAVDRLHERLRQQVERRVRALRTRRRRAGRAARAQREG